MKQTLLEKEVLSQGVNFQVEPNQAPAKIDPEKLPAEKKQRAKSTGIAKRQLFYEKEKKEVEGSFMQKLSPRRPCKYI